MNSTDVVRIARDVGFTYIEELELIDFTSEILEIVAKEFETYGVIQDMGGRDAAEIVRTMKVKV